MKRPSPDLRLLGVTALFSILALHWLWPLPLHFGTHVAQAPYWWDAELNAYLLGAGREALLEHPLQPLEARILHPAHHVLAYSENLLSLAVLGLPFHGAGTPVGHHNVLLLLGAIANGVAAWLYLRPRVRSTLAALVGAVIFTFAPFRLGLLSRLQHIATPLLPLLFLAVERALVAPRFRRWLLAFSLFALELGVSIYQGVYLALLLAPVAFAAILLRPVCRTPRALAGLAAAAAIAGVPAAILFAPYATIGSSMGFARDAQWIADTSGRWADLGTTSDLAAAWRSRAQAVNEWSGREPIAFPGAAPLFFGALGLLAALWSRRRRAGTAAPPGDQVLFGPLVHAIWVALCLVLFLGTGPDAPLGEGGLYGWLVRHLSVLGGLRYPNRLIVPGTLALGALAAFGVDALALLAARFHRALAAGVALCALGAVVLESRTRSLPLHEVTKVEPIHASFAGDIGAEALVELPFDGFMHQPRVERDRASLQHRLFVLSGYTGYEPPLFKLYQETLAGFPDERSRTLLTRLGVNRVLVHEHLFAAGARDALLRALPGARWLRPLRRQGADQVIEVLGVEPGTAARLRAEVRRPCAPDVPVASRLVPRGELAVDGPTAGLGLLIDGQDEPRWTLGHPQRDGEPWFRLTLKEPRTLAAVWLDVRKQPLEYPRGLRLYGVADGKLVQLAEERDRLPLERLARCPGRDFEVFRFAPTRLQALVLVGGAASAFPVSIGEVALEEAAR